MKRLVQRAMLCMALVATAITGTIAAPTPASADHQFVKGVWTRSPVIAWDGVSLANIQDAAYFWQDRGFRPGYTPPLPGWNHGGAYCTAVWDQYINVCTIPRAVLQPYCDPNNGPCDGMSENFVYSGNVLKGSYILIADDLSPTNRQKVWRHEFGHAIGLGHTASTSCLMYKNGTLAPLGDLCFHDKQALDQMYLYYFG